jgi:chromosome segregation ATPase
MIWQAIGFGASTQWNTTTDMKPLKFLFKQKKPEIENAIKKLTAQMTLQSEENEKQKIALEKAEKTLQDAEEKLHALQNAPIPEDKKINPLQASITKLSTTIQQASAALHKGEEVLNTLNEQLNTLNTLTAKIEQRLSQKAS